MVGLDLGDGIFRMTECEDGDTVDKVYLFAWDWTPDLSHHYFTSDLKGDLCQIKCLLGRRFNHPELQSELDFLPFRVIEGPNGDPLVHVKCRGEDRAFTPIAILAMLISHLEKTYPKYPTCTTSKNKYPSCIGVPIFFNDKQRNDMFKAAITAGLVSPSLLDETTAMALGYAHSYQYFEISSRIEECIVAFVYIGHASMQVCFAEFDMSNTTGIKKYKKILYQGYVKSIGERDFTRVLFMHFASMIRKDYSIDVYESARACVSLTNACEVLRKDLSRFAEAFFCIEKFSGPIAVMGSIKRTEFEEMSRPILEIIKKALQKALCQSGLNKSMLQSVEAVGNGLIMPAISNILIDVFGKGPKFFFFSDKYVARGCSIKSRWSTHLAMGPPAMELYSSESRLSKVGNNEDSERSPWRRAMNKALASKFFNDIFDKSIEVRSIAGLMKNEELNKSFWLNNTPSSIQLVRIATNNFDESFKLGEGGFGVVYKGILDNTSVAIKILKEGSSQGEKEFHQEIEILGKLFHPNLVTLIGACSETRALIYEYLPNGSLEDRLRCKNNTPPLQWQERVRIAFEICLALSFLHSCKPHGIVHGDLKPDNVLLDANSRSKICDFGLCRLLDWTASASIACHWTDNPKGTLAYMDPEYLSTGKLTPQYDVYSFGIMLLRLVTCKDPRGLRYLVEEAQKKNSWKTLVDASAGPWPFKEAKKMISLGLRCSNPVRKNRPDLSTKVLKEMKSMLEAASASGSS